MKKICAVLALSLLSTSLASHAATLTLNARILPSTCVFDANDLVQGVNIPASSVEQLQSGNYNITEFEFKVTNCDPSTTHMTATLTGPTMDSNVPGYGPDSVLAGSGTAVGVGIGMIGRDSVTNVPTGELPIGTESAPATLKLDPATQTNYGVIKMGAQVVPTDMSGYIGEGSVSSQATITLTTS